MISKGKDVEPVESEQYMKSTRTNEIRTKLSTSSGESEIVEDIRKGKKTQRLGKHDIDETKKI